MVLIDNEQLLSKLYDKLSNEKKFLCIDTEFDRRNTYYAKLSTIQICNSNDEYFIIDALKVKDLSSIIQIIKNDNLTKIFHSAQQDLEIFSHYFNFIPNNIFDTQIAAKFCNIGHSDCIGYSALCKILLNTHIDKSLQKTNWLKRPITQQQISYLTTDVKYLPKLYKILQNMMQLKDVELSYNSAIKRLVSCCDYKDISLISSNISDSINNNVKNEHLLKLVELREKYAQKFDIPRKRFINDAELIKICEYLPTKDQDLYALNINNKAIMSKYFKNSLFKLCTSLK